jgi:hypothetical protein
MRAWIAGKAANIKFSTNNIDVLCSEAVNVLPRGTPLDARFRIAQDCFTRNSIHQILLL